MPTASMSHPQLLYDIWVDDPEILKYVEPLRSILLNAAKSGKASVFHDYWYQFEPHGVTGYLLLKQSHISIHTWVEEHFAAIDVFPSGAVSVEGFIRALRVSLNPRYERRSYTDRGIAGTTPHTKAR